MALQGKMRGVALIAALAGTTILGGCAHTMKRSDLVIDQAPCADTSFTIYFKEGSAKLTPPAHQLIDQTANGLRNCTVTAVEVVGLTDSVGSASANFDLSQRRAHTVVAALNAARLPAPRFSVAAGGQMGAVTAGGEEEPVRRRAEVMLRVSPRT